MRRVSRQGWTPEDLARLSQLVRDGASATRASAALNRTIIAVQTKAKSLGTPFVPARQLRADRLAKETADARKPCGHGELCKFYPFANAR